MTTTEQPTAAALARSRENLIDTREVRGGAERLEFREDKSTGQIILQGYASTYDPYDVHGGPAAGGWVEQISQRAFDVTLANQPDVQLLINHEGTPLARTKSGTLKLSRDRHGLKVWASLDPSDPDVQRLVPKMRRGDMDEMSFAFRVQDQTWDDAYGHRTITELSLQKGDVSVVNYGMNPSTRATLSAETVGALAQLSNSDLVELRKLSPDKIEAAAAKLAKAAQVLRSNKGGSKTVRATADVKYADPGYKPDGKKRYPIDTKDHAKAAWSYINMPKNQKGYTSSQVASIKTRVEGALKKFGVAVGDDKDTKSASSVTAYDWQPGAVESDDPHNVPYSTGSQPPVAPAPPNVVGGTLNTNPSSSQLPTTSSDPHEQPYDQEVLAMDTPQDTPYSVGDQVPGQPGDRPNYGSPKGATADNIIAAGNDMLGVTPVLYSADDTDESASRDMDECGDDMDENCDEMNARCDGGAGCAGASCPEHGGVQAHRGYNPETGDIDASRSDDDDDDDTEEKGDGDINLNLAAALDRTITHAYKLAEGNLDLRKVLATAQRQLSDMRGINTGPDTDVTRKLTELRAEVGQPDTGDVEECMKFLRSAGSGAPVGYRGLLDHDPDLHIITAAERLAMENIEKARRASSDQEDSDQRLKRARREAELNRVIREKQAREARTGRIPSSIDS